MLAEWIILDTQNNSLANDLSEEENLTTIKETINDTVVRLKEVIYWATFVMRRIIK
jgi:hypothetical protein